MNAEDRFLAAFRGAIRPEQDLTVSEWADEHRILSTRSSPEPGRWRTERTPYLKDIMDALSPQTEWETVVFMKGAQIGATEAGNNWIGYNLHMAPGPMLAVQPTVEMAKRNSKQRIGPLIDDCSVLAPLVQNAKDKRAGGNNLLAKEFPGGILVMTGANSSKGLRSMAARYLFLDEVDGYPGDVEGEGDPCDLAITRTHNFAKRKIFVTSTPVISGRSRIEHFYGQSDQCEYFVPCPKCGAMQTLRFEVLRWPKGKPDAAVYPCQECEFEIRDGSKNAMLPRGEWRPQTAGDGKTKGFHLSSLYSPAGWLSWGQIAAKYEAAKNDREKQQVFTNTILGRPWVETGETPDFERLYERRETYPIGMVPQGGLLLTAGADVQLRRIEVEVVAWGRRKNSWSIDYRVFEGDTQQPAVWRQLADMLDEDFESDYGNPVRITKLGVDTGFNTTAVYDFVRKIQPSRVMAIKGDSRTAGLIGAASAIEVGPQGHRIKYGIRLYPMNSSIAKEELYRWLRSPMPNIEMGEDWPVGYCHFPQYSMEYFEQLTAEHLITKTHNGLRRNVWEKRRERNEALDCRLYARAAAASLRFETFSPQRWDDLETALTRIEKLPSTVKSAVKGIRTAPSAIPKFEPMRANESFLE